MNIKRSISLLLSTVMLAGTLGGCSAEQDKIIMEKDSLSTEERVSLSFFGFKEGSWNVIAIESALRGFMNQHPEVNITYEGIEGTAYWDALDKRAVTGNMNDVIMVDHDYVMKLSAQGKLADLSDLPTIENYGAVAQSQFPEDGPIYFLPTCISTYGLCVNLDLLQEHGQKVPSNLSEFTEVCDYFVSQGITPIIGNNYSTLRCLMAAKGLYLVYQTENPKEEIQKFNSGESSLAQTLRPGVELVGMMLEKGWFDCEEVLETAETWGDTELFVQGERPFMVTGGWVSPTIKAAEPGFEYAIYPFPILEDGSVLVQDVNTCISVNAESENLETAKQLAAYLTQTDVMWEYCDSQSSFTPLQDDRIPADQALQPTVPYLTNGRSVIGSDYNLELPIDSALKECGDKMLQGMDADSAAEYLAGLLEGASGNASENSNIT